MNLIQKLTDDFYNPSVCKIWLNNVFEFGKSDFGLSCCNRGNQRKNKFSKTKVYQC